MSDRGLQRTGFTFQQLYEEAQASLGAFGRYGHTLLTRLHEYNPELFAGAEFKQGRLKSFERAEAKLIELGGNPRGMADLVRGRILVDTAEQIAATREFLTNEAEKLGIELIKDRFAKPNDTHYRDIVLRLRLYNGHVCEIQINQRDLLATSKLTHKFYEEIQAIDRRAEAEGRYLTPEERVVRQWLLDYTRDAHDLSAARIAGIDDLLSEEGRARLDRDRAERLERVRSNTPDLTRAIQIATGVDAAAGRVLLKETFMQRAGAHPLPSHELIEAATQPAAHQAYRP